MSQAVGYVEQQERNYTVTVIDVEDAGTPCRCCGESGMVFSVHCWREENRPIVALCKACAMDRAGGEARVAFRSDRDGLLTRWQANARRVLNEREHEQRKRAAAIRHREPRSPNKTLHEPVSDADDGVETCGAC
jgi:hypothetical protein